MAVPRISKETLKERIEGEADEAPVVVDVRLKYPYEHSTVMLPGAVRLAPVDFDPSPLPRDREIVAYDSDPDEVVSARVVAALHSDRLPPPPPSRADPRLMAAKFPHREQAGAQQKPPQAAP